MKLKQKLKQFGHDLLDLAVSARPLKLFIELDEPIGPVAFPINSRFYSSSSLILLSLAATWSRN